MTFEEILDQAVAMLQRRGQVAYSTLKMQFQLDAEGLEALKDELLFSHPVVDRDGRGLVWTGDATTEPDQPQHQPATQREDPPAQPGVPPLKWPTLEAERRQLTVMFCDLADYTKLSAQLDPEDLRDVIQAYQSTSAEVIEHFGGYIAQHLGDGLMVYFGWPQAHEDDAQRAVHGGLGLLDAMRRLNVRLKKEKGIRLAVRIGIHRGLVVIGEIGRGASQEHLALGETPNIASRIEGIAEPDTVAISHATYQLVQGYFVCDDLGQHTLKGLDDAQQVYRVEGTSGAQSRFDVVATRGLIPLVGRESEVALLLERWKQVKEGQGQAILISGEAGLGKSRLVQAFRDQIAGEPHICLECRSSPYYQNTALYPITDLMQRTLQWQPDEDPQERVEKLERMLKQYRLPIEESVPLFASLLSLPFSETQYPPLSLTPQRQRQKTLETMVAMVLQQAERQPVLLILEDLHWTDPSTLELLDLLMDHVPTASVLMFLTCRPEFELPQGLRAYLTHIKLNRLTRFQIEAMVEHVVEGKSLPAEVMQHLVAKTDGVPLYVEEMTKATLVSGVLEETDGHYELKGPLAPLAIPMTLQDSLMARLDRLETAKSVAQLAATMGRKFTYQVLHAVSPLDEATLRWELRRLVEAELVYQLGPLPHATFTFKHALIQDTAYQSLLRRTRQQYHQRIAQVLEQYFPETVEAQPELLAHHYTEADQNEDAIRYWQRAGQHALQGSAHEEAIAHLRQGLALLERLPDTPARQQQELDIQVALGPALMVTNGFGAPEGERAYARARELCAQIGDTPQLFPVLRGLMLYYLLQGPLQTAYELGEQLLRLAQSQPEPALLMLAHYMQGMILFYRGEPASAQTHHLRALVIYIPQEHRDLALRYGIDLGVSSGAHLALELWHLGYPDQALHHSQKALALAQEVSHPFSMGLALLWSAILHQWRREALATREQAAAATNLATEQGFALWLAWGTVLHGWTLAMQGQGEEGRAEMRQGLAADLATGDKLLQPYFLGLLAEAYGESGRPEAGLPLLAESLAVMDTTEARFWEAELYRLKGALLLQQAFPDEAQAEACFYQAIDIARNQQAKSWELRAATSLARLSQQQGKRQDAYDLLAPVYGWFTEGLDTVDLQEARALLEELEHR